MIVFLSLIAAIVGLVASIARLIVVLLQRKNRP